MFICFGLIIFQTAFISDFFSAGKFYDLSVPFILFMGMFRPVHESLFSVFFLGFFMDNLSGGPFGLYGVTYLWLFAGARWIATFLHVNNYMLLPFVAALGVLTENFIFFGVFVFLTEYQFPENALKTFAEQILWAIFTGVFFLMVFYHIYKKWDEWLLDRQAAKQEGNGV
ncbi:Uncharacterized protein dnm_093130 [Desulfonema magnum]|uniref:Rod shape-determining protein MreD n=2 Tax=Desulfonema magnum TaxID=45655 RepID=A0A975BXN8_9BACT|nr:Uncharacterized protein dnm_093130 [Desulfonema magnum]